MATNVYHLMRDIHKKWKQGFKVSDTEEFMSLFMLCTSENCSERFAACKSVGYLLDWKVIDLKYTLNLLSSLAYRTKDVDGVLAVCFNIIVNLCHNGEDFFLQNDLKLFHQSVSNIMSSNENTVPTLLSLFSQLDISFIMNYFKPIVYDAMLGEHANRSLAWSAFSKRIHVDLHRSVLLWLKFTSLEDCCFLLHSLKTINITMAEKCLHLSAIIRHMLASSFHPQEAINLLYDYILETNIQIQSLVFLTLMLEIDSYPELYVFVVFDLCGWFLNNATLWKEVLWIIIVALIPLCAKSLFYRNFELKTTELIDMLKKKASSGPKIESKFTEINSITLKHVIYRHNSIHQSLLLTRLLGKFNNDDNDLIEWLKELLNTSQKPMFKIFYILIGMYFLTKKREIRKLCLSILEKWKADCVHLYIFQLNKEDDQFITQEIVRILSTKRATDDSSIVDVFLKKIPQDHRNSFSFQVDLLKVASLYGYKLDDSLPVILNEKTNYADVLSQAALVKTISSALNIHFEVTIPFCNNIINVTRCSSGSLATAFIIDAICTMCEKGVLDISVLWNKLLSIVAGDYHPAVNNSVCNILSKVPQIVKSHKDANGILYKSARVLWHYVKTPSANTELALRSLREYDLDIFDATFLSEDCKFHLKYSSDSVIPQIKGNCWIHMINNHSLANLFAHYINKKYSSARYYGSYSSLFEGVSNYLSECSLSDGHITICLEILCANWTRVPAGRRMSYLERFICNNTKQEIKELALLASLNHYHTNDYAKIAFDSFISMKNYTESDKAIMCLLPSKFLEKQRQINENILFEGLLHGLNTDCCGVILGSPLNTRIEQAIISCAKNESVNPTIRRVIMKVLIYLWMKLPFNHQVFKSICKILTTNYGYAFLKSLPYGQLSIHMSKKYIHLSREIVLKTKSLYCFDTAITIGQRNERYLSLITFRSILYHVCQDLTFGLQHDVMENFLYILKNLGDEKRSNNKKWILRILCSTAINGTDFMCTILIHGVNFLTGTAMFNVTVTLKESLDCFPLAISSISKSSGKGKDIILTLNELVHKRNKIHPVFIEVFKLGIMRIRDEPQISYSTVIRKTLL